MYKSAVADMTSLCFETKTSISFPEQTFLSLSLSLSLYTPWRSLSSIIGRCTLYTPGCRMKAYK